MKIAKRALAIIMAVALVGCMSAMAFAAGSVALSYDGSKNITVTAVGMIGMKSFDFIITADDGVVLKNVKASSDAPATVAADNAFTTEKNMAEGKFSGYFKENLWELDQWQAAADDLGEEIPAGFNPSSFNMGTIVIDASGATGPAYVYVKGTVKGSTDVAVDQKVLVKDGPTPVEPTTEKPAEPTTEKPAEPTTKKPVEPTTQKPAEPTTKKPVEPTTKKPVEEKTTAIPKPVENKTTVAPKPVENKTTVAPAPVPANNGTQPCPNTGDKPTGDNMALAAAAGIVALAGAAFVISKKRK